MKTLIALAVLQIAPPSVDTPLREPQLAVSQRLVALAYGSGEGVYVATSLDGGATFGKAVKVTEAHVLPLNRHRGPRVVITKGQIVVSAVTGHKPAEGPHAHGLPSDGDLFAWRSSDGGKTWTNGVRVNDVPTAPREGLHALAADDRGNLFAAWLDLRAKGTRLYGARSSDGGASWSANMLIYESPSGSICECCHPSALLLPGGGVAVMFRNSVDGARDFYLSRSVDGRVFARPEKLGKGTWKINGCPMDGGSLVMDGGKLFSAWRRESEIFLAEPGQAEARIGAGKDVAMVRSGGRTFAAWNDGEKVVLWSEGKSSVVAPSGAFPSLAALPGGGALAAWEDKGGIAVHRVR